MNGRNVKNDSSFSRFQALFSSLPPFDCAARCKAPDAFFSGSPWLSHPENGTLLLHFFKAGSDQGQHLEWQIWNGLKNDSKMTNYTVKLNSQKVNNQHLREETRTLDGLKMGLQERWISDKILSVKLFIKAVEKQNSSKEISISIENEVGKSEAFIKLVKDAEFGPWSRWSACSKSCIGLDEKYGVKTRNRTCFEGFNGGQTCAEIMAFNASFESSVCAGSDENLPKICPMHFSWTKWTPWTNCSATCGPSSKQRTRTCIDGQYGGPKCLETHHTEQKECKNQVQVKH